MTFILRRTSPYVLAFFPFNTHNNYDIPSDEKIIAPEPTTRFERFKNIFHQDEFGNMSAELQYCIHLTGMGLIVGGFYGAIIRGKSTFFKFIDNNQATMFANHLDAKRKLQDAMALSVGKGAFQWGWRTAFFTSVFAITSTSISVFRGKSGIIEYTDAGLAAGAVYNFKNGIRGAIVGGGLGAVLGTFFGTISYVVLSLAGKTMEDVRFYTYEWRNSREDLLQKGFRKKRIAKDEEEILKIADNLLKPEGT